MCSPVIDWQWVPKRNVERAQKDRLPRHVVGLFLADDVAVLDQEHQPRAHHAVQRTL